MRHRITRWVKVRLGKRKLPSTSECTMSQSLGLVPFKLELVETRLDVTAHAGLSLVLEAMRVAVGAKAPYRRLTAALGYDGQWVDSAAPSMAAST